MTVSISRQAYLRQCISGNGVVKKNMLLLVSVIFIFIGQLKSQDSLMATPQVARLQDTVSHKKFPQAAGTLLLVEAIPFTYNHFIAKEEFAKISLSSIKSNLQPGNWKFDDDQFITNQFAHPYHGNLYFNSFRSNGYGFYASAAASLAGSMLWEIAGEQQAASPNDMINTTLGGLNLGEMTHRLANKILFPKKKSARHRRNELYAFLLNPVNGFTRLVDGKWGHMTDNTVDNATVSGQFDLGMRRISKKDGNIFERGQHRIFARANLYYQDSAASLSTPFREFIVRLELGHDDTALINNVSVYSSLYAWDASRTEDWGQRFLVSINYDMYHNYAFYYGAQSFNMNWISDIHWGDKSRLTAALSAGPVVLAAIPDSYLQYGAYRRYDYASGLSTGASVNFTWKRRFFANASYKGGIVKTINGIVHSHYYLHTASGEVGCRLYKGLGLFAEYSYLTLLARYRDYDDYDRKYPMARLFVRYDLKM